MNGHGAEPGNFDYDPGYPQTFDNDFDNAYDRVTARDITDLLHHLAEMRCSTRAGIDGIDHAERAAFLSNKADLFTRIARRAERTRVDNYSQQVRQMAADARAAAEQAQLQLPQRRRVGPDQRRTTDRPLTKGGARSEENSGASSG